MAANQQASGEAAWLRLGNIGAGRGGFPGCAVWHHDAICMARDEQKFLDFDSSYLPDIKL